MTYSFGVIFDCDGTLLDSMGMWHSLDDRLAARAGVTFSQADKDRLTASTLPECGVFLHQRFGIGSSPEEVMGFIHDEMLAFYRHEVKPKPGAVTLVNALAKAGVPMAVASSTPPGLLRTGLEVAGLADAMEVILSVEDVGSSKREPVIYDKAREALGTDRASTWGVEDALYAVCTLKDAGYRTLAVFDSMTAGSPEALARVADVFRMSLAEVSPQDFR